MLILSKSRIALCSAIVMSLCLGCGEEGQAGSAPTTCGAHGAPHDGHCHCDTGYLFDGDACVAPDRITEPCDEVAAEGGAHSSLSHVHGACRCPASGDCPCDEGSVEAVAGRAYCVPELHDD